MIRTILFDLDDTLYPRHSGIMEQIRGRIMAFICTKLGFSRDEANVLRQEYLLAYGTTMRGLQINHHIDTDDYLHFVHDIPLHQYIQPDPELDAVLGTIPQQKVVFTNASREHAEGVLAALGIRRHFERIIDVRDMDFDSKPQPAAYTRICHMLGVQPKECMLVEDNVVNLRPAKALGMVTVLVDSGGPDPSVDYAIPRIQEIGAVIRALEQRNRP
jgi:putative hydrolase of the HAD superfamily